MGYIREAEPLFDSPLVSLSSKGEEKIYKEGALACFTLFSLEVV